MVSTTVVEVGVKCAKCHGDDDRKRGALGLAQLHQLRGRVGRGGFQSYCIMVRSSDSQKTKERLEILNQSNDGFYIAGEDLKLRGRETCLASAKAVFWTLSWEMYFRMRPFCRRPARRQADFWRRTRSLRGRSTGF